MTFNYVTVIGLIAAACTTFSFLPQALKTIRTKDTSGISLYMYLIFTFGTVMWLVYGISINSLTVALANAVTTVLAGVILVYKIRYR